MVRCGVCELQTMAARLLVVCLSLSVLLPSSMAVDKNNFKTCSQSSFCRSAREGGGN